MVEKSYEEVPLFNIANVLTVLRLVLAPIFIFAFLDSAVSRRWIAVAIFFVAALTDKLDGYLARRYNLITNFGKLTDAIADKVLIISALLLLSFHGMLWWWVTILFIVRELGITTMRMGMRKIKVMAAGAGGKIKMFAQSLAIGGIILPWSEFLPQPVASGMLYISYALMGVALFFALTSAYEYVREAVRLRNEAE